MTDITRYHRQTLFHPIGEVGQEKLANKHVLLIGCGALGSSAAEMLARAGIGELTLIDRDYVELTNLQRQHLFTEEDVKNKIPKVIAAVNKLQVINSEITINSVVMDATADNLADYIKKADLIIDATDNFDTRFVINDLAHKYRVPWIFGACVGSSGMTFTIIPGQTPCLNCLLKVTPVFGATCDAIGVIGPAVQMVVTHQVTEAIKILIDDTKHIRSQLIIFDLWNNHYQSIDVSRSKQANCTSCGGELPTFPSLSYQNQTKSEVLCGRDTVQIRGKQYSLGDLASMLSKYGEVQTNAFLVSVVIDSMRLVFFHDGRTFVHGTSSIEEAKKLYYQVIG
ncbi:sulfur carrier protein adenylyltransferase ThiF [Gracilibacillus boraciitolerans JCM 21714]|uniref:Sulfur carrier protein adenylyltransferase ThiF n=1 Tax=Gracilibacillus boraciitolerans JCM 21714 TaxID=1298598 RepID=W4VML4_9BACI|nr:ThiF family adenylyltransferase [Gracilibacillus boraciitolerans]GAE93979.1 sulfur carrier protein adenylyltransferase ThiF [Gracilibacillus boraciitolerans JCM 21714]